MAGGQLFSVVESNYDAEERQFVAGVSFSERYQFRSERSPVADAADQ